MASAFGLKTARCIAANAGNATYAASRSTWQFILPARMESRGATSSNPYRHRELRAMSNDIQSAAPKVGDSVIVGPILGCPHVPQDGWTVDRVETTRTYYLRHPNGSIVTVPREQFRVKSPERRNGDPA